MKKSKPSLNKNIFILWAVLAIALSIWEIFFRDAKTAETLLKNLLFFTVGCNLLLASFVHWYQPTADKVARGIGWPTGSGFQKEVAAADGAFGLLGILCFWIHGDFWTATVIGASFMLFFMGIGHLLDVVKNKNMSPLNAGSTLWLDLLLPVALISLLVFWKLGY